MEFQEAAAILKERVERVGGYTVVPLKFIAEDANFQDTCLGIYHEPKKSRGRTLEEVANDTLKGKAAEIGTAWILEEKVYDEAWDVKDRHSFGKDLVTQEGIRLEIKSMFHSYHLSLTDHSYKTLCRNIDEKTCDVIVAVQTVREGHIYHVKPQMIIEPSTFRMLCDTNRGLGDNIRHEYMDGPARKRGYCVDINREED